MTLSELGAKYGVHQTLINAWKLSTVFESKSEAGQSPRAARQWQLAA